MKWILPALFLAGCATAPRPPAAQADASRHSAAGLSALASGDAYSAIACFDAALSASQILDDLPAQARDLHNRGIARLALGDAAQAERDLSASLALADRLQQPQTARARTRLALAQVLTHLGKIDAAIVVAEQALTAANERDLHLRLLATRAALALRQGDRATADARLGEGLARAPADPHLRIARAQRRLLDGDANQAADDASTALAGFQSTGDAEGVACSLATLAQALRLRGDGPAAAEAWRRAAAVPVGPAERRAQWIRLADESGR